MTSTRPDPGRPLDGETVRLRALGREDLPELFRAIGHPAVFAGGWGGGPAAYRADFEGWREFVERYLQWDAGNVYAVCLRSDGDRIVGTSTLGDFELENGSTHIGWTAYAPDVWGTRVNAAAKRSCSGPPSSMASSG